MWYSGGKFRQSKQIVAALCQRYDGQKQYVEPFCGAMGVAEKALPALYALGVQKFILSDISIPLMVMWKAGRSRSTTSTFGGTLSGW